MRVVQLTAGTGSWLCGTCLRDADLVSGLKALGVEAELLPMYLPIVTETDAEVTQETQAASDASPVLFGGVNVYLQQSSAVFRHTPRWLDRVFDSRALLNLAGRRSGATEPEGLGPMTVSMLEGQEGRQFKEVERLIEHLRKTGPWDAVLLSNALLLGLAEPIREALEVPVICTLQGEAAFIDELAEPWPERAWATMRGAGKAATAFIAVSRFYGDLMSGRLGLTPEKVHVVRNGIALNGYPPPGGDPEPPVLGFLARMNHDKGLHRVVDLFLRLVERGRIENLQLHVVGVMNAIDEPHVTVQRRRIEEAGLTSRVVFEHDVTRAQKIEALAGMSLLSVPTEIEESFGLYVLESMAASVPVVLPNKGAFPEILDATGGGVITDDTIDALADGVEQVLLTPGRRAELALAAHESVHQQWGTDRMARGVAQVLEEILRPS